MSKTPGRISDVVPTGSNILVELLTEQESLGTRLTVNAVRRQPGRDEAIQAYVLAVGPGVKISDWGFNIGDRVILSGMAVPIPKFGPHDSREKVMIEPHAIRGVVKDSHLQEN